MTVSETLFQQAQLTLPGGVNSPVRAFNSVQGTPPFIRSARGAYLYDEDGCEYVDLVGSWGPALLGHAYVDVLTAVHTAVDRGLSFGAATWGEVELGQRIMQRVPAVERVRLVSTGTEATMTAVRLARGYTGRNLVVKFAGCYHGHVDSLLAAAGSGLATLALPGSAGVTTATAAETLVLPYNDLAAVQEVFASHGDQIAAVITEAAPANMGVVTPAPGFNANLAKICAEYGALFIMDEVLTGFRVGPAGYWGLDAGLQYDDEGGPRLETAAWVPDLFTFGKVIGGGLPVAALGGRADVMEYLAPEGPVYQAGTLSGNPVAMASGIATLDAATPEVYARINRRAEELSTGVGEILSQAGVAHSIQRAGNLFSFAFGVDQVRNYDDAQAQESFRYPPFFHAMLDEGVYLPPSVFEAWFLSAAHDDLEMERILSGVVVAAQAAAQANEQLLG